MESDVVFAHELIEFDLAVVLPPLFPFIGIVGCDRDVTNWRIEPHVEYLLFVFVKRDWCSPFEISSDAAANQTSLQHAVCKCD